MEVPDWIFISVTYNKHLEKKSQANIFKADFKAVHLMDHHIFHFSSLHLSLTSSATLEDTSTMEEFSQAIQIYIWFPPPFFI